MKNNSFNLLDENWIPVAGKGKVSLKRLFEDASLQALGGITLDKLAVLSFVLGLAQHVVTPKDDEEWSTLGPDGVAKRILSYLDTHRDCFWLYGEAPFLQIPACEKAKPQGYGAAMPEVAFGNTSLLSHQQLEPVLDDAAKALLLLRQMGFCFGGKKPDHKLVLSPGYEKKSSAHPGSSIAFMGLLHSYLLGSTIRETVWLNLLTQEDIAGQTQWTSGVGPAPWEKMPTGEACPIARQLKASLMGRLVPLTRFCLLTPEGLKFTEGIVHEDYSTRFVDPSVAIDSSKGKPKVLWADPEKSPWRQLPALLTFLKDSNASGFFCLGLRKCIGRVSRAQNGIDAFGIWSAGVRVSNNAGEQYLTGTDDMVESEAWFPRDTLGDRWFDFFRGMMEDLEKLSSILFSAVNRCCTAMKMKDGHGREASGLFWQMVEPTYQSLVYDWEEDTTAEAALKEKLKRQYRAFVLTVYDDICPHGTARQFELWARNRPFSGRN